MKFKKTISIIILLSCITMLSAADVKIGVLAKRGAVKAMQKWKATAEYLTETIEGKSFEIVPLSFEEVFPAIENKEVDFFLVNSSMYMTAHVKYNSEAICTLINSKQGQALNTFGGVIITSVYNDNLNTIQDLKGHSFMAVKSSSFGGWQMAYKELLDGGVDPFTDFTKMDFGAKHDNVVLAVISGTYEAGTIRTDTIERMAAEGMIDTEEIKIINEMKHDGFPFLCSTALYPEWPLAKLAHVSSSLASDITNALKKIDNNSPAAKSAKIIGWSDPLDYSGVEDLQKKLSVGAYE